MRHVLFATTAALSVALPTVVIESVGTTGSAAATASPSCNKVKNASVDKPLVLSGCTPAKAQYATAKTSSLLLGSPSVTITWSPSSKTTVVSTESTHHAENCPSAGSVSYALSGSVIGGTATYTKVGDVVSGKICVSVTGTVSLATGSSLHL